MDTTVPAARQTTLRALPFLISYLLPVLYLTTGRPWVIPLFIFGLIPLLDALAGRSRWNPADDHVPRLYDLLLWLWPAVQFFTIYRALILARSDSWAGFLLHALATGIITGGVGVTYAHELIHRRQKWEVRLGEALLISVAYLPWRVEHVRGHHVRVGTPEDPATAPKGMSVYRFIPRSTFGGLAGAWRSETERLAGSGRRPRGFGNIVVRSIPAVLAVSGLFLFLASWKGLLFFWGQAMVAVILLECVNYVEHYGLERERGPSGRPVPPDERISWNADQRVTNWFLINLQRHSDHHVRPRTPYPLLRTLPGSPLLPAGYATMILLALVPPLWFRMMDR